MTERSQAAEITYCPFKTEHLKRVFFLDSPFHSHKPCVVSMWKHSNTATGMHRVVSCYGPLWKPRTTFLPLDTSKKKKKSVKSFSFVLTTNWSEIYYILVTLPASKHSYIFIYCFINESHLQTFFHRRHFDSSSQEKHRGY